ncbi:long-chain fatty acid--CoA ligase [Idiomarina sp. HP20-50]|uniref:long-chain fatty acid--CoA ligase n=1 Tax=Idiomarina sp. HP20-50 TaxID=3070813 RepID=UPI00294AE0A1|nr:long-chain fatty acid--CoA ligase [Idiomarina sp. HP20-50]MDV6315652.1 long-chain fatty acid--CoA ligase [Idiomarina sp. HP20-50]
MLGNMMKRPLQIIDLLKFAANRHPRQEIVTRRLEGDIHRYSYADCWKRSGQLAHALEKLGVKQGERVASLAWNTYRHMELYYAVSGSGAIMHTVNPRLFGEQIAWILDHAESGWVFVDLSFVELLESIEAELSGVTGFVIMTDRAHMPKTRLSNALCYEDLLASEASDFDWPDVDEDSAALLCYTSGTTGNPKGVLSSHRAMVLHAQATISADMLDLRSDTVLMPMVTMYHVAAWGAPYAGPLSGCKLVFTGDGTSGEAMATMIRDEHVTVGLGVPTIWLTLHNYLSENNLSVPSLKRVCVGGAASPAGLVKTYDQYYGVYWQPIWGMTETGPLVHSLPPQPDIISRPKEEQYRLQTTAGRPVFGIEHRIVDADNKPLPNDGEARGELQVRGHWIASQYFRNDDLSSFPDGWLATGDIAVIEPEGFMKVVDRKKDVIKSGGEWISSLDIENIVSQHEAVNESCVIGVKHPKWDERPLLLVVLNKGQNLSKEDIKRFLDGKIARWWMPDDILFVTELPHTGTGKLLKKTLRQHYQNHLQENQS